MLDQLERMRDYNFAISEADNVHIIHDDGVRYTKTSDQAYSLIINTVTTPLYFSSSKLYTLDFLRTVEQHLTSDGVYVTWIDDRIGDRGIDITLKTLAEVFEQCALSFVTSRYYLLLCSEQPLALHQIAKVAAEPGLQRYLTRKFEVLPEMLPYSLLHSNALRLLGDAGVPINTLDYPVLEFEMARLRHRTLEAFLKRLYAHMDVDDVGSIIGAARPWDPMWLNVYPRQRFGNTPIAKQWQRELEHRFPDPARRHEASLLAYLARLADKADTASTHYAYAYELLSRQRVDAALAAFARAAALDPAYSDVNYYLGFCFESSGDLDRAIGYYEKELKLHPASVSALRGMGSAHLKIGQPHRGLMFFDRALQTHESAEMHYLRAEALAQIGEEAGAIEALRRSLYLAPGNEPAQRALNSLQSNDEGRE